MKISFAVNNLRSLVNMEPVELRPLTLLVGANNSGKSTFLRTFALLRQSLEENITEPLLWNDNYVDFGGYSTAVRNGDRNLEISFSVRFNELTLDRYFYDLPTKFITKKLCTPKININNTNIDYHVGMVNEETLVKKMNLNIENFPLNVSFVFELSNNKIDIIINEKEINLNLIKKIKIIKGNIFYPFEHFGHTDLNNFKFPSNRRISLSDFFADEMYKVVSTTKNGKNIIDEFSNNSELFPYVINISEILLHTYPLNSEIFDSILSEYSNYIDDSQFILLLNKNCIERLDEISEISRLNIIFQLLGETEKELRNFFLSSSILGSLRSYYTRTFSLKGLDVSSITVDGRNFSMFLLSLKESGKLTEFSKWTKEIIGYEFEVEKGVGNMSIYVIEGDSKINLIDSGFGLSNLLPVLAQIWLNTVGMNGNLQSNSQLPSQLNSYPICIEEPELHLHQRLQARLADAFTNALESRKKTEPQPLFIVETHSEVFINRLGKLVEDGKIKQEDVQIILFEKKTNELNSTKVSTSTFDENGALKNWPSGFMYY